MQQELIEKRILGHLLFYRGKNGLKAMEDLLPVFFTSSENRQCFIAMQNIIKRNNEVLDEITLHRELWETWESHHELFSWILELIDQNCLPVDILWAKKEIIDNYNKNKYHEAVDNLIQSANKDIDLTPEERSKKIISQLNKIYIKKTQSEHHMREMLNSTIEMIENNSILTDYLPTSFRDLDEMLIGLPKSNLIIIGARPSMGKTAFAVNLSVNMAKAGKKVLFCSLEQTANKIALRMLASESKVNSYKILRQQLTPDEEKQVSHAYSVLDPLPIIVDDNPLATPNTLKIKTDQIRPDVLIIDYLTRIKPDQKFEQKRLEVGHIVAVLKDISMFYNIPVVCLAQLNRELSSRSDKTPVLTDLRETGDIEQDADIVMFLHRPGYYESQAEKKDMHETKLVVAKNRDGKTGTVDLSFDYDTTRFSDYEYQYKEGVKYGKRKEDSDSAESGWGQRTVYGS